MLNIKSNFYAPFLLCIVTAVTGCTTTGGDMSARSAENSDQLLLQAREALASGAKVRAQKLLEDATKTHPADKQPWLKLAQLYFDQGSYAQAVTAGQEALARDAGNQEARSIVLVSSLRIAAKSLAEMSQLNQLSGDARSEAKKVATILRENLGEEVLVPEMKAEEINRRDVGRRDTGGAKSTEATRNTGATRAKRPPSESEKRQSGSPAPAAIASPPANSPGSGRSDPFGSMR